VNQSENDSTWEAAWEVMFPVSKREELLVAMVVRDLLHGASFDLEGEREQADLALDYLAGDELEDEQYRLLVTVEATGPEDPETVQDITKQLLEQLVDEAEALVAGRQHLASEALANLRFDPVPEDEERWDLVTPDWLAPDGAVVPYGFRPSLREGPKPWPTDSELDRHGRIVAVPFDSELHLYAIPAPVSEDDESSAGNGLPVLP